ncbi:HutD/Ves family protein [Bradyrhizobium japonicum]|jgi:environmental stress-induced protein Ves|uniref:Environmental stress-induced protein Ves n=1 Tax=Bradyrhizobium japonicum TaxID=375 RepID=A0ABV2S567_BRAJP|nr:HutD family protein [Bradyrhizobium japonicum]MCP1759293.1 environmental stress-induced protein Ves [Bradyrhizobium japonicum]MCP1790802.1 environmental stress-induced protein Ves [Bradyrhizobium japonicum]MCP1803302.1 environmental stress-induced protein Ves [Bradyrhizobium japonicum]MCP1812236.1 environmental stress-induced protein Ves [Bradyrhizobium japonicum]MCP1866884.1 environmental stress-induced protein Ves [Bradyrhizobium japonicum]
MKTTLLKSEDYTRSPWKNGGGIFTDIADAHRADAQAQDWDSLLWRFASTPIVAPGPFSYMPGIDRLQMVVGGRGLVLKSPSQDFDEREPFTTVRFTGEMEIVTELEAGPVEVVNLMARRGAAEIELLALREPGERPLSAGTHLVYAVSGDCSIRLNSEDIVIPAGSTLKVELTVASTLALVSGLAVLASIQLVG